MSPLYPVLVSSLLMVMLPTYALVNDNLSTSPAVSPRSPPRRVVQAPPSPAVVQPSPDAGKLCAPVPPGDHERYHLPPPTGLPAGLSFMTDWTQRPTGGWYGEQVMDACRMRPDGFLTSHGKAAVRVEVQPKDDPLALNANSERAEMLIMQDSSGRQMKENRASGTQYYATSYYFPLSWHGEQLPWSGFPGSDCSTGNQNQCNSWSFVLQFYGWGGLSAANSTRGGKQSFAFNGRPFSANAEVALGKWTDLVFMANWETGNYTIWRRDEGQTKFAQVLTGAKTLTGDVVVKQGLYRGGNVNGRTDVLWIGATSRGDSFSAVERASFGTTNGF